MLFGIGSPSSCRGFGGAPDICGQAKHLGRVPPNEVEMKCARCRSKESYAARQLYMKLAFLLLAAPAAAQMGARNMKMGAGGHSDVDLAMAGWEQLSQNPDKMAEVMASLKDPEVMAKAAEMMKDPTYMAAAKAKVQELQAKATQNGMLDADGNPVQNNMAKMMAGLAGQQAAAGGASDAREWELENIARHKSGELNDAELGMANMQKAMQDPSLLASIRRRRATRTRASPRAHAPPVARRRLTFYLLVSQGDDEGSEHDGGGAEDDGGPGVQGAGARTHRCASLCPRANSARVCSTIPCLAARMWRWPLSRPC